MTLIIRFIILAAISISFSMIPDMGNATTYVPGAAIFMTGTTGDARFDVTEVLYNSGMAGYEPRLETATKTLKGYFYLNTLGWVDFNTGSYIVLLDCGVQDIANLSSDCALSGTGWSELAGEVGFSGVQYLAGTGVLSGSIHTLVGTFSLSDIYLPLRPVSLQEDLSNLIVSTSLAFSVSEAYQYGNTSWNLEYTPKTEFFPQTVAGNSEGKFSADISFADDYTLTITDPSGSTTAFDATVIAKIPSTSSFDATNNFIHKFCNIYPAKCPDGTNLSAGAKEQDGAGGVVADGLSNYHIKIKPRDMYGNQVSTGTVSIVYDASISSVQIPLDASGPTIWTGLPGDALIFSGELFTPDLASGKWSTSVIPLFGQDISYDISSVAPTDMTDNTVLLNIVEYTSCYGDIVTATDLTPLEFTPAFESDVAPVSTVQVNAENGFQTSITKNTSQTFTPNFITTLSIGSGANAFFQNFSSVMSIDCEANSSDVTTYNGLCEWAETNGIWFPSVVSIPAISSFTLSGTYTPTTPYPVEEPVTYTTFIHYSKSDLGISGAYVGSDDIVYQGKSGSFGNSGYRAPKVKVIGQNNALGEYGNISVNRSARARFIDTVRKNTSILSRNRSNYDSADYLVYNGNLTVTGGTFANKRTIVSIGGNITIDGNISKDISIAVIALTDKDGNGGNIIINPTVTDIDASLVAEHSILSSGDYQLYIHGSLISANTLGDTLAQICPYYITATCDETEAAKYDLEKLRAFDGTDSSKVAVSPTAGYYPYTPLIIDYNLKIEQDPPPILY